MNVTEVRISLRDDKKLRAFVTIVLDNTFVIHGLKIIQGKTGLFVAMPSRKGRDGEHQDVAHPINAAAREALESAVLAEYATARGHRPPVHAQRIDNEKDEEELDSHAL
jgi:stage V sporulation protein G